MNKDNIRKAYVLAIEEVFGIDRARVSPDVHVSDEAPGQWSPDSVLEIYCEQEIPNATDYHDLSYFGGEGYYYHSEEWIKVDEKANEFIKKFSPNLKKKLFHEPYNNAVVTVWFV